MIVYFEKIDKLRKQKRLTLAELCKLSKVGRTTFWSWQKGIEEPKEPVIRMIARTLDVAVEKISDLTPEPSVSENKLSETESLWFDVSREKIEPNEQITEIVSKLLNINKKLNYSSMVVRVLLTTFHSAFYIKDVNMKFIAANRTFFDTLSLKEDYNIFGKQDEDFFSIQEAKENSRLDREVLKTGIALKDIEQKIPGTRKKRWGAVSKLPVFDADGKIVGLLSIFFDITARKDAERLRLLLEAVLSNSTDGICIRQFKPYKIIYLSNAIERIFGYPVDKFYNDPDFRINACVHPEDREREKSYRDSDLFLPLRQYRIIKPNGDIAWIQESNFEVKTKRNIFRSSISRDITEQYKKDKKEEVLFSVLNHVDEIIYVNKQTENGYKLLYYNDKFKSFLGSKLNNILNDAEAAWINLIHPDYKVAVMKIWQKSEFPKVFNAKVIRPCDKQIRWMQEYRYRIDNLSIGIVRDVTELKEQEALDNSKTGLIELKKEMVLSLKNDGVDIEIISNATGLSLSEIEQL